MEIGSRLKRLRTERGLSLSMLAAESGLTKGFLSQIEAGRANPSLASLSRLASALGVSTGDLLLSDTRPSPVLPSAPKLYQSQTLRSVVPALSRIDLEGTTQFAVATLEAGSILKSSAVVGSNDEALCAVRRGSIILVQGGTDLRLSSGDMATWRAGHEYRLVNDGELPSELLLCLPTSIPLPELEVGRAQVATPATRHYTSEEGPFRLVEMRAARRAAGRT